MSLRIFVKNPGHPACQNLLFNLFLFADITPKLTFLFNKEWVLIFPSHSSSDGKNSQLASLVPIFCFSPVEIHFFFLFTRNGSDKLCQYNWVQNWLQPCWSLQCSQFTLLASKLISANGKTPTGHFSSKEKTYFKKRSVHNSTRFIVPRGSWLLASAKDLEHLPMQSWIKPPFRKWRSLVCLSWFQRENK